jgi:hypothetical protein
MDPDCKGGLTLITYSSVRHLLIEGQLFDDCPSLSFTIQGDKDHARS